MNEEEKSTPLETTEQELVDDINEIKEAKAYISWIQTYSKRIVTVTFILYLVITLYILISVTITKSDNLGTIYSEINETFRVVIGGYLLKAAVENAFKIRGNYISNISNMKLDLIKRKHGLDTELQDTVDDTESF